EALPLLTEWTDAEHAALADLGYEGEQATLTIPIKRAVDRPLTHEERTVNALHAATRALTEVAGSCAPAAWCPSPSGANGRRRRRRMSLPPSKRRCRRLPSELGTRDPTRCPHTGGWRLLVD